MRRLALKKMVLSVLTLTTLTTLTLPIRAAFAQSSIPSSLEGDVLSKFHRINKMEIKAGRLAKSQGRTPEVRKYGDRLIRDHQLADKRVVDLAKRQEITLLEPVPKSNEEKVQVHKDEASMKNLEHAVGTPAFDQQFLLIMEQGHRHAIQMLTDARDKLPDTSAVRGMLFKLIPILEQHHELATHLEGKGTHS